MSYCVNCGVELDKSAKKCALCQAPVINPMDYDSSSASAPYPDKVVLPLDVRFLFNEQEKFNDHIRNFMLNFKV